MFVKVILISVFITVLALLTACTSFQSEKAPCNEYATGCGTKIKINQW